MVANYSKNGKHNGGSATAGKAGLYPKGKGKFSANHKYSAASDYNSQHLTNVKGGAFTASGGFSEQKGAAAPAPAPPAPVAATSPSTNYAQFNAQATGNANNETNQMNVNVCAPPLAVEPMMSGGGPLLSGPSQPMMNVPTVMNAATPNQPAADMNAHQMMIGFNPALIGGFPMFNAPIPCGPAPDQNGGGINPHSAAVWGSGAVAGPRQPQSNQWQNNSFNGNKGRNSYNSSNGGQTHQSDHSYYNIKGQHNGLGRAPSSTGAAGKGDSGTDRGINPTNSCKGPHDIADKAPTTSMGNDHDGEYTVMVQNLPADCTVHVLRKLFERSGFPTTEFNYLYLPNEFVSGKHMGYCFVNFRQYKDALRFLDYFNFHKVADFASLAEGAENKTDRAGEVAAEETEKSGAGEKAEPETWEVCDTSSWTESKNILKVKKALVQGLSQNLVKLRQNDVLLERMCEKPEWCPLLFNDKGVAVPFSPDCKTPPATEQELTDFAVCSKDNTSSTKETASSSNPAAKQGVHGSGEGELEGINGEPHGNIKGSETGSNHAVPAPPPAVYPTPQQLSQMNAQAPPAPPADYLSTMMKLGPTMPPAPQMPHVPYPMYYPSQLAQFPTLINTNTYPAASTFPAVGTAFIQAPGPMQMPQMQFPLMDPMAFYCPTPV